MRRFGDQEEHQHLKALTENESNIRRILAFILGLVLLGSFMSLGLYMGFAIPILIKGGGLEQLLSNPLNSKSPNSVGLILGLVFAGLFYRLAVNLWTKLMRNTQFISEPMIQRITRFGPY